MHPDDLSGRFADKPGWRHLVLPFIADEPVLIKYGDKTWKRKDDELLRPDAYSEEQVEAQRAMVGPPDFETLFQQNAKGVPWACERVAERRFACGSAFWPTLARPHCMANCLALG